MAQIYAFLWLKQNIFIFLFRINIFFRTFGPQCRRLPFSLIGRNGIVFVTTQLFNTKQEEIYER